MRTFTAAILAVFATACLSSAHPQATRAQARFEIAKAIAAERDTNRDPEQASKRRITEVGEVTADTAVVFTEQRTPGKADGAAMTRKREERWVRGPDGWKVDSVKELGNAAAGPDEHASR